MNDKTERIFLKYFILILCILGMAVNAPSFAAGTRWDNEDSSADITGITNSVYRAVLSKGGAI